MIEAKPRNAYVPPVCSMCRAMNEDGTNYTRVYATKQTTHETIHYCMCHRCDHTFKHITRK